MTVYRQFKLATGLLLLSIPALAQNTDTPTGTVFDAPIRHAILEITKNAISMPHMAPAQNPLQIRATLEPSGVNPEPRTESDINRARFNDKTFPTNQPLGGGVRAIVKRVAWQVLRQREEKPGNPSWIQFVFNHVQVGGRPSRPYVYPSGAPSNIQQLMEYRRSMQEFGTPDVMMPPTAITLPIPGVK